MLWPLAEPSRRDVTSEWTQHGSLVTTYSSGKITHASDIHHFLRLCHCLIIEILICVLQCITVKQTKYKLVPFSPASYVLRKAPADLKSTYMSKTRHDLHASSISKLSLKKKIYLFARAPCILQQTVQNTKMQQEMYHLDLPCPHIMYIQNFPPSKFNSFTGKYCFLMFICMYTPMLYLCTWVNKRYVQFSSVQLIN